MQQPRTQTLYDLFNARAQFVVPVYQRAYVWNEYDNWSVLWDDLTDVAERHLSDPDADPPQKHFLGPVVLEQQPSEVGGVDRRLVIDGQQRLTTLQVLISSLARVCEEVGALDAAKELAPLTANTGRSAQGTDRFKVWPSRRDRDAFRAALEGSFGDSSLEQCAAYFRERAIEWIRPEEAEGADTELDAVRIARVEALQVCVDDLLYVVSINLDKTDNAQVIFETLNARGTGLGALDLVKNAALLAAEREGSSAESLNDDFWEPTFEADDYWGEEVRQGRQRRSRSDWFLMHWLAMRLGRVVKVDSLFDHFRKEFLGGATPMATLIPDLCRDARTLRSFDDFEDGSPDRMFFDRMEALDTTTMIPLALLLYSDPRVEQTRRLRALHALESWLVRRAILRLQSRGYNRQLAQLLEVAKRDLAHVDDVIVKQLASSEAATAVWPSDVQVQERLEHGDLYGFVGQPRVRMLLEACERDLRGAFTEDIALPRDLSIEHVLPQQWRQNWALPEADDLEVAEAERDSRVNRLGNLTLVTQPLNTSMSNREWIGVDRKGKREALAEASVLLLNRWLADAPQWTEAQIDERGADLARRIIRTWPGAGSL